MESRIEMTGDALPLKMRRRARVAISRRPTTIMIILVSHIKDHYYCTHTHTQSTRNKANAKSNLLPLPLTFIFVCVCVAL